MSTATFDDAVLSDAFRRFGEGEISDWERQETCFAKLLAILKNVEAHPDEPRYRRLKATGEAFRAKVLAVDGAETLLQAAGFHRSADDDGLLVLDAAADVRAVGSVRERLQEFAERAQLRALRAQRDERIARAKAEDGKVTKHMLHAHLTPEQRAEQERQMEIQRREVEKERELNPAHASQARQLHFGATEADAPFKHASGGGA
eukprot:TRINITY_DN2774_c2_g1_i1.p1 TRINITY_DN2774_c2_g1~~TRINITY_DN2774_c2_g1_i1.p1  ORF type:complete len:226 (-),score=75.57 TRINITY_DN2774_c2_g1_i1:71-682(-)